MNTYIIHQGLPCIKAMGLGLNLFSYISSHWTMSLGSALTSLSSGSLTWLRFYIPAVEWRFDFKLDQYNATFMFSWTKDAITPVMELSFKLSKLSLFILGFVMNRLHADDPNSLASLQTTLRRLLSLVFSVLFYCITAPIYLVLSLIVSGFCSVNSYVLLAHTYLLSRTRLILAKRGLSSNNPTGGGGAPEGGEDSPINKKGKGDKRKDMLKRVFSSVNELDVGQDTTNPYVLATRHIVSGKETDVSVLNSILAHNNFSLTQEEYDTITAIKPVSLPYPLPNNDSYIQSIIGSSTKRKVDMTTGVYVLTFKEDGQQYVGSSVNIAMRLRTYYNAATASQRTIASLMALHGPSAFTLDVYIIDGLSLTEQARAKYLQALEQYLILVLKSTINDMLVVGGLQTKYVSDDNSLTLASDPINAKPLYVYNSSKDTLLYISPSRAAFEADIGVGSRTVWKHIKAGEPLFNTYIFTDTQVEGATTALISTADLKELVAKQYSSNKGVKHSVTVTDLTSKDLKQFTFSSKEQARKYVMSFGRPVGKVQMSKLPCRHNGWLVEFTK